MESKNINVTEPTNTVNTNDIKIGNSTLHVIVPHAVTVNHSMIYVGTVMALERLLGIMVGGSHRMIHGGQSHTVTTLDKQAQMCYSSTINETPV